MTASILYNLIERYFGERKIIISTHHVGMFSILSDWLKKGEKSDKYRSKTKASILRGKHGEVSLESHNSDVFLYHLRVLQLLKKAQQEDGVRAYHLSLLRKVLESVSSFLGVGRIGHTLKHIGFEDPDEIARMVNTLAHKNVYYYETDLLVPDILALFDEILEKLNKQFAFVTRAPDHV